MELHRKREPGMDLNSVYDEFISIARSLETYGIDPHPVKDHRGTQLYVGINFSGISTFSVGKRVQHFRWPEVQKLNFEGKMYIIHLTYTVDREVVSENKIVLSITIFSDSFFLEKTYCWVQVSFRNGM